MDLPGVDGEVNAFEDFVSSDRGVQIFDFEQTHLFSFLRGFLNLS
jgi:hypothetical protein